MTASHIKEWTSKDKTLFQVKRFILIGWPENLKDKELKPFFTRRDDLSLLDGCVLWGTRVIVPPQGRAILNELHETHPGVCVKWGPPNLGTPVPTSLVIWGRGGPISLGIWGPGVPRTLVIWGSFSDLGTLFYTQLEKTYKNKLTSRKYARVKICLCNSMYK